MLFPRYWAVSTVGFSGQEVAKAERLIPVVEANSGKKFTSREPLSKEWNVKKKHWNHLILMFSSIFSWLPYYNYHGDFFRSRREIEFRIPAWLSDSIVTVPWLWTCLYRSQFCLSGQPYCVDSERVSKAFKREESWRAINRLNNVQRQIVTAF